jgi:DNA-binding FadR family transcriptional regulator
VAGPTVREALQRLKAMRVVEVRHGSGIYAMGADPTPR